MGLYSEGLYLLTLYIILTFYKGNDWIYRRKSMAKYFNIYIFHFLTTVMILWI